jgi:uncharacterized membrane protein YbhN (UPF0104 family)
VQQVMGLFRRYKRVVQLVVFALIAVFLVAAVRRSWAQLTDYQWDVQWGLLLAAFALFILQELSYALVWRTILVRLGHKLDVVSSERIYLSAEFVRYIPGNVWHVITRVLMAERRGVPKAIGFASMVVELATKIISAALAFAISLFFWPNATSLASNLPIQRELIIGVGVVGVPLLLLGLHPRILQWALNRGLRLLKREPVTLTLSYRDILLITLYWALSWVVAGAGFYLLVLSIISAPLPATALILAVGINALGWDVGFLAILTPSGVGFREAALVALLLVSGLVPAGAAAAGLALVIAVLARLLTTGSELVCISAAYLARGGGPLPVPEGEPVSGA